MTQTIESTTNPGTSRAANGTWWVMLAFLLALSGVLGALASLLSLVAALILGILLGPTAVLRAAREPFAVCFLAGYVLLNVTTLLNAGTPADIIHVLDFVPMLLALPVFAAARAHASAKARLTIAILSLSGVVLALIGGVLEIAVWGSSRPYGFLNNAIIYGHTVAVIGFLALTGYFLTDGLKRFLFLLGPVLGAIVLVMSGTRGGMLALPGAFLIAFIAILYTSRHRLRVIVSSFLVLALLVPAAFLVQSQTHGRAENLFDIIPALIWGNGDVDNSTATRLRMYQTGFEAFLDAPLTGHGWTNQMQAAAAHMSEAEARHMIERHFHLHNDLLNFAVSGGVFGIAALMLFLAAPVAQAFARRRDFEDGYIVFSFFGSMLALYVVSGLFFMTLGFDISTTIFAFTTALVAGAYAKSRATD